jgi:hypothetical protein
MIKLKISKQLAINKQHRLGSHEEQLLLFSLVHLILCSPSIENQKNTKKGGDTYAK